MTIPIRGFRLASLLAAFIALDHSSQVQGQDRTVRVGTLTVYATKANGSAWDAFNGAPDLLVQIRVKSFLGQARSTSKRENTYSTNFGEDTVRVRAGQAIEINVLDKDFAADDTIGLASYVIDSGDIQRGVISLGSFGRVESLTLFLVP